MDNTKPMMQPNQAKSKKPDILTPVVISFLAIAAFMFVWWLAIR